MRFVANLKTFKIRRSYLSEVNQHFAQLTQQAAHQWLRSVLMSPLGSIGPIPVWSGASAATFTELAAAVAFPLGIVPSSTAPNRISFGTRHGRGGIITEPGKSFRFFYETSLGHLIYNEFNNANLVGFHLKHPGPYFFQQKGRDEFESFAKQARMPDPFRRFDIQQIRV